MPKPHTFFKGYYKAGDTLTFSNGQKHHQIIIVAEEDTLYEALYLSDMQPYMYMVKYILGKDTVYNYDFWGYGYDSVKKNATLLQERIADENKNFEIFFEDYVFSVPDTSVFTSNLVYNSRLMKEVAILQDTFPIQGAISAILWNMEAGIVGFIYKQDTFTLVNTAQDGVAYK